MRLGWKRWGTIAAIGFVSAPAGVGWCGWQTFTTAHGLVGNEVRSIVEDHSGRLWFGSAGALSVINDVYRYNGGGVSRYDGLAWHTFTTADGLPSNSVWSLLEDRSGNLWAGSAGSVSRYDGSTWRSYAIADGLPGARVTSILEDRSGTLWFGTYGGGVAHYDGSTWETYTTATTANGLAYDYVNCIVEDRSGSLWFATGNGLSRYDGSAWVRFSSGAGSNNVTSIVEDLSGTLWCGTGNGLGRFDGSNWHAFPMPSGLASYYVQSLSVDRRGDLWVGTGIGVSRYDGSSWRSFAAADDPTFGSVNSLFEDSSGNIWIGTSGGAIRYDGSSWRIFGTADGLIDNYIWSLMEDHSGKIWVGTSDGLSRYYGLSGYDGSSWISVFNPVGGPSLFLLEDRSGIIWVGTSRGVSRYDGSSWSSFLGGSWIWSLIEDRSGNIWAGTSYGVSRYDGATATWRSFTIYDGVASGAVYSLLEDRSGAIWIGATNGLSRYDGSTWFTFQTADGVPIHDPLSLLEDRQGHIWVGAAEGVFRFDGSAWRAFTSADGLGNPAFQSLLEDRSGNIWAATSSGVSRYDGSTWHTYTTDDGLGANAVRSILEDRAGNLWFGTYGGGVTRYDGSAWRAFTSDDGLGGNDVASILEDRMGNLWFEAHNGLAALERGVSRYEPDRVPPQTVFVTAPPRLSTSRNQSGVSAAAFGETRIEFSYQLDGAAWSGWSPISSWVGDNLADGTHVLAVRSRDFLSNTDSTAAVAFFEIDATPPAPVISEPSFSEAVRGTFAIRGTAADARFASYRLEARPSGSGSWSGATLLVQSASPAVNGALAAWDTGPLADGMYDLRLSVTDSLGLTGSVQVTVLVDNHFPFASESAPARVTAATGGDVYSTNAETHLYFPPHAFDEDAVVLITAAPPGSAPTGAAKVLDGYELGWAGTLKKPARFTLSYAGVTLPPGTLALYRSANGITWERLGGTVDAAAKSISLAVSHPGRYALFADNGLGTGAASLSGIAFTPRVFSPTGAFADQQVGISFRLGRPAPVTVKVYSRSGRLIREVATGLELNAGENLVRWDGTDRNGGYVVDGMYLVTVEALGHTETRTLAVVK